MGKTRRESARTHLYLMWSKGRRLLWFRARGRAVSRGRHASASNCIQVQGCRSPGQSVGPSLNLFSPAYWAALASVAIYGLLLNMAAHVLCGGSLCGCGKGRGCGEQLWRKGWVYYYTRLGVQLKKWLICDLL